MGSEDYVNYEENLNEEENNNNNGFHDYEIEDKLPKSPFKKKISQAKRFLTNQASKEYSQVHQQQDPKTVPKMLVSVSKINGLKALVNTKTKKYGKPTSPTYLTNNSE